MLKNYKRIAAFGASVTQQENGYADQLAKKLDVKIKKFGYGGMHLPDAGVCFIDKVLSYKPEVCLIDWFSTGYMECTEKTLECIDTILYKFSQRNCSIVFLILPGNRSDPRYNEQEQFYNFCRKALKQRNAYFIDIDDKLRITDLSNILRDSIHTTKNGGKKYAEIINEELQYYNPLVLELECYVDNAAYKSIQKMVVNRVFFKNIDLTLDANILGIFGIIGRHSGICNIEYDNKSSQKIDLWDRWCHFERNHFDFMIPQTQGKVCIRVLQDNFDTSSCKMPVNFQKYKKYIACREIYWQGTSLVIENIKSGSKFTFWKIEVLLILRDFKHFVGKNIKRIIHR